MTTTPRFGKKYFATGQLEPDVTFTDLDRLWDVLAGGITLKQRNLNTPPGGTPAEGDAYFVGTSPTGDWAGQASKLAVYENGAWAFYTLPDGIHGFDQNDDIQVAYNATELEFHPLQHHFTSTEHWTGEFVPDKNGSNPKKLHAAYLDVGAGPGTAGVPKSTVLPSTIDLSYPTFAECVFSDDVTGFAFPCPHIDFASFLVFSYFFTATTFNVLSSFTPATNFDVKAYVKYVKDS